MEIANSDYRPSVFQAEELELFRGKESLIKITLSSPISSELLVGPQNVPEYQGNLFGSSPKCILLTGAKSYVCAPMFTLTPGGN